MSLRDVVEGARAWLSAIVAHEEAEAAFRAGGVGTYDRLVATSRAAEDAALTHLAAVKDLPNDGVPDDRRIASLRTDNERLRQQVRKLKFELDAARRNNEERNRELDALHYVWCDGGCTTGAHRYCGSPGDVTEEVVAAAERNTQRLRRWFVNYQHRKETDK